MKQSIKVLLFLGLAIAINAAGQVTKKLGEAKKKALAQTEQSSINDNFFGIPAECLITAEAPALEDIADCKELSPSLAFCPCNGITLPPLAGGEIIK